MLRVSRGIKKPPVRGLDITGGNMSVPQPQPEKRDIKVWAMFALGVVMFISLWGIFFAVIDNMTGVTQKPPETQTTQTTPTIPYDTEPYKPLPNSYVEAMGTSECTSDCSGHEAGWEWAERYEICSLEYDNGKSVSFDEGVHAWAKVNCTEDDFANYTGRE